jgi:hypothetical protein
MPLNQKKLYRMAKSLFFRRRMAKTVERLENEIRNLLLDVGKNEIVSHGFRISVKEAGDIKILKLSPSNLKQLELSLGAEKIGNHFKDS